MGKKRGYNVMAVYSLRDFAGREMFVGTLEETWRGQTPRNRCKMPLLAFRQNLGGRDSEGKTASGNLGTDPAAVGRDHAVASFFAGCFAFSATYPTSSLFAMA